MSRPSLFLDFDGVLHPVWPPPLRSDGRIDTGSAENPRWIFDRADALDAALAGCEFEIVLSTDWVRVDGLAKAASYLPARLAARVVGGIAEHTPSRVATSRGGAIATFVAFRAITHWIAVDDDDYRWPREHAQRLVATDPGEGISEVDVERLVRFLRDPW